MAMKENKMKRFGRVIKADESNAVKMVMEMDVERRKEREKSTKI